MNLRLQTFLSGGLILILSLAIWLYTATFPELDDGYPGPSLFPRLVAIGLAFCGLILILQEVLSPAQNPESSTDSANKWDWLRLLGGFVSIIIFPELYKVVGFIPSLSISCLGIALLLGVKLWQAVAVALGAAVIIYLLFTQLLSVPL